MINNRFALYQLKREIKRNGTKMKFFRKTLNEFGETGEPQFFCEYTGLYHEHAPHISDTYRILTGQQNGTTRTEKYPQLLVPYEDFYFKENPDDEVFKSVELGDIILWNKRKLKVTGILNVQEWNMMMDISFEEVDIGGTTGYPN